MRSSGVSSRTTRSISSGSLARYTE
jgi:hypothetical protein